MDSGRDSDARGDLNAGIQQAIEATARDGHQPNCPGFENLKADVYGICKAWCWGHMKCEPLPKDNSHYMVCGECMHVFMTADELVALHNEVMRKAYERFAGDPVLGDDEPPVPVTDVNVIYTCPVCAHDF